MAKITCDETNNGPDDIAAGILNVDIEVEHGEGLSVFTIYKHPKDYPDKYVVRRSVAMSGVVLMDDKCQLADTLEEARKLIPPGLVCLEEPNTPELPAVESWI
jgi:hypothetical protein